MLANITDPVTATGSILRIVTAGVQLGTALQTYMELVREAESELHDTVFDVNATAAALKQLHAIIDADRDRRDHAAAVFKDDGIREVETLALKCHAIYSNIILLIQRARPLDGGSADRYDRNGGGASSAAIGVPALDPTTLPPLTLMSRMRWPWLRPRILRCRKQLNWLKVSLLFTLQMASIAQWQMSGHHHAEASQEMELSRETARQLQDRRNSVLRTLDTETAGRKDEDAPQGPNSTISSAASSLGVATSTPKRETARHKSVNFLAIAHDTGSALDDQIQSREMSCTAAGKEDCITAAEPDAIAVSSCTALQARSEISGAPATAEFLRLAVKPIPNSPPSRIAAQDSASTATATERSSQPKRLRPIPTANNLTSQLPVIIDQFPSYLNHWADHVFGRQNRYRNDKQSTSLEAYLVEDGREVPIKIPFGHERLSFGLERVLKDWRGDQWTNYLAASPETRLALDGVTEAARKASNNEKICLAFKQYGVRDKMMPLLLAFFSLEPAKDPVIVVLNNRRYSLPFAACRTLHDMEQRLREVCVSSSADATLLSLIDTKRYELQDQSNNNIIMPAFLIESLKPGIELGLLPPRKSAQTVRPQKVFSDPSDVRTRASRTTAESPRFPHYEINLDVSDTPFPERQEPVRYDLELPNLHVGPISLSEDGSCSEDMIFRYALHIEDSGDDEWRPKLHPSDDDGPLGHPGMNSVFGPPLEMCTSTSAPSRGALTCDSFEDDDGGGDGLNLDVLNADQEMLRQDMSIDKWLELMTNVASVTRGVDDT